MEDKFFCLQPMTKIILLILQGKGKEAWGDVVGVSLGGESKLFGIPV